MEMMSFHNFDYLEKGVFHNLNLKMKIDNKVKFLNHIS